MYSERPEHLKNIPTGAAQLPEHLKPVGGLEDVGPWRFYDLENVGSFHINHSHFGDRAAGCDVFKYPPMEFRSTSGELIFAGQSLVFVHLAGIESDANLSLEDTVSLMQAIVVGCECVGFDKIYFNLENETISRLIKKFPHTTYDVIEKDSGDVRVLYEVSVSELKAALQSRGMWS